jgi:hypothetical protein
MRININAWCRYRETYSLEITESYLAQINEWIRRCYPEVEFEDITAEDIYAVFSMYDWDYPEKLKTQLDNWHDLGSFVEDYVRQDVWECYEDNEYIDMDDYDTEVEFDTAAEREHFEGPEDDAE